ncbi:pre-mRNA-splicing factor CWC25 homolog isoform X2 [Megalobrama amblycephala]|uniref:pre-mRNA-splicing factor CWC25 homolog isoform X2 n=1 Tax=Megalobrama amblycephala TaxID=75352 RepID=UPI00201440D1|nr:pre-mRNA-splicing factor CWC25 homolog isoform X2 [Megalobrama amblycephala]
MGGGDLNLKKSWHPQTLKNIERVWKAEQKHEAERKKIEELQKELKEERAREEMTRYAQETGAVKKKDDRLDWMYQGPAGQISREEYLLGRPIDKQITQQYEEPESGPSAETGLLPGSIFNPTGSASTNDMAAKIREDPLFEIRKREEEKKRVVLTNPVKMKEIQKMLRHNLEKEKKKKRKREKREEKERRKEKKHRKRSSSSDEEDQKHRSKEERPDVTTSNGHLKSGYGLQLPENRSHHSSASNHTNHHSRDRSRSPFSHKADRGNHSSRESEGRPKTKDPSSQRHKDRHQRQQYTNYSKRLSAEELEKKRREMMDFAREREIERENNVKRYKRQEEQEKANDSAKQDRHAGFIHDMKLESAATSSVEDRVKRNIHSIQRTPAALEKNFMRR